GRRVGEPVPHGVLDVRCGRALTDAEEAARQRGDHVKGQHASVGERAGRVKRHAASALHELVAETALARARLRDEQDDPWSARAGLAQSALEQRDLALAPDEAREAARPGAVEAALRLARAAQVEHPHGQARALESLFAAVEEVEEARREARGLSGH